MNMLIIIMWEEMLQQLPICFLQKGLWSSERDLWFLSLYSLWQTPCSLYSLRWGSSYWRESAWSPRNGVTIDCNKDHIWNVQKGKQLSAGDARHVFSTFSFLFFTLPLADCCRQSGACTNYDREDYKTS